MCDGLATGAVPHALDLPTGLGKTTVMALWLLARAAGATVPRRLVYVVDRRAVVDQASSVADALREALERRPELSAMKASLGLAGPLPISTLRGAHLDRGFDHALARHDAAECGGDIGAAGDGLRVGNGHGQHCSDLFR
jgi:CRISPR-associated helicase Cas3